jgi:glycosyltransferase involved in cell wall biosynthesis
MRIVFVQYGDYRASARNFASGGKETYHSQRYSDELIAGLKSEATQVAVVCVNADPYDDVLPNGIRVLGMRLWHQSTPHDLVKVISELAPTHLIPRTPLTPVIRWATRERVSVLPMLADSFPIAGLRARLRNWRLGRTLNNPAVRWVGNHNVSAARDLERIGVKPEKVVPWDWPPSSTPDEYETKTFPESRRNLRLIYVGAVSKEKGVGDCIEAVALLNGTGWNVELTIVGSGEDREILQGHARHLGVGQAVRFTGRLPRERVVPEMHEHDVVIVPSRHEYAEGMPRAVYDALSSRTPLVVSDHPVFAGRIEDRSTAMVFRAARPESLAECLRALLSDSGLYESLSTNGEIAWRRLQCPVRWGDFLVRGIRDSDEDRQWLTDHSLASGRYT